jgi:hypothetical protein
MNGLKVHLRTADVGNPACGDYPKETLPKLPAVLPKAFAQLPISIRCKHCDKVFSAGGHDEPTP